MPRNRQFIRSTEVFHVGARTNNKEWFELPLKEVWPLVTDLLSFTGRAFHLEIQAFVLMSNHYHLLVRAPDANLPEAMCYFNREMSKSIGRELNRINHVLGAPYFASLIRGWQHHHAVYKYVYRNPVDAGICGCVETYPYSSLRMLLGFETNALSVIDPLEISETPEQILSWLNFSFQNDQREFVRKALRRPEFGFKPGPDGKECRTEDLVFTT
jgi:REP element-mobilizing transposase RayT